MTEATYRCQLCYVNDNNTFNPDSFDTGEFLIHLWESHQSSKARDMLETIKQFGTERVEYMMQKENTE